MPLRLKPVSPATLAAGTTNDYAGIGSGSSFARLSAAGGGSTLTGIVAGGDGDFLIIVNISANNLTLKNQDAGSAPANRFLNQGADIVLNQDENVAFIYDATTQRWRQESQKV